jgi:Kdo2-lipid IVA lauroyltransferase/acyltransferase
MSEDKSRLTLSRRLRHGLEHALLRAAAWTIPKLPRRLVRGLSAVLGTLAWLGDSRGRRTGMENLRVALGPALSMAERRRILRASYRVFAATFLDLFWSPCIKPEDWDRYFVLQCDTPAAKAALEANNCIYIAAHFGGFELLNVAKTLRGGAAMTIAQDFKNPALTGVFARLRSVGARQEMIPQEGAMLRLFKHLKRGGSAGSLVDLKVDVLRNGTPMRTFGMFMSGSPLHCVLAQRTGLPIVPIYSLPASDGRLTARLGDPIYVAPDEAIPAAMQRCWDVFENVIRARPEQWLWMYKHWRYRPAGEDPARWPKYAVVMAEFDELLAGTPVS